MKGQGFLNLSPKISEGLDHKVYLNAKRLFNDSQLLCGNSSYSTATSIMILSSEEIIKAFLILLHSKGYKVYQINGAKKFFTSHRVRHEIAELIEVGAGFYEYFQQREKDLKNPIFKTRFKTLNTVLNFVQTLSNLKEPIRKTKSRIESLEEFDTWKNIGFYVDYQDGLRIPKERINKEVYIKTEDTVIRIFHYYKIIRIIFHPKAENHIAREDIEFFQKHLHSLINESFIKGETFQFK